MFSGAEPFVHFFVKGIMGKIYVISNSFWATV